MTNERILIVEDETVTAMALRESAQSLGYEVVATVPSGEEAIEAARKTHLDIVLMDIRLKGKVDGITAAETIRKETDVPSIYLTAYSDRETLQRAKIAEPYGYLVKPYDERELGAAIEIALHNSAMERDRRQAEETIVAHERLLQEITDNSPGIIYVKDKEGRYTLVNRTFENTFGLARAAIRGKEDREILPEGLRDALWPADQKVLTEGKPAQEELTLPTEQGARTYLATRFPVRAPNGEIRGVSGVLADITALKRTEDETRRLNRDLEREVAQRTQALLRANEQLEEFNRMVSHDLRTPLRGIAQLAEVLEENLSTNASIDDADLIRKLHAESKKLGMLLQDLAAYSQSARSHVERTDIDLTRMAREILTELQRAEPERAVDITIPDDMRCEGDPLLLHLVLANILGNAWKYTSKKEHARIEMGTQKETDGKTAFYVKDNGAGFDMRHASRLFQPFQRLHYPTEFPGTGLGLSSVKRIIERHGGKVWAEGKVAEGATFWFAL